MKYAFFSCFFLFFACTKQPDHIAETEICNWYDNKKAAISITYDDATINQFRQAIPIMDSLGLKGTFFINTADIPDSKFPPKFIGRSLREIIDETKRIPTTKDNLFERGSALRFLDIKNAIPRHNDAGSSFEQGNVDKAISIIDSAFAEARTKKSFKEIRPTLLDGELITWPEIKQFASNGHEFGNHTISHPRLAILDEPNLLYELEKCKEEIFYQLGPDHIFSAECPFGTENERVMQYAYKIHPALRNRMPEPFLEEINRASSKLPGTSGKPYVQWQRGPLQKTSVSEMKSWVDTLLTHNNNWLVLTFHGIDGVGWEAKPHEELRKYFSYMKEHENDLWVDTFGNVTKYMREKMNTEVSSKLNDDVINIDLTSRLDTALYHFPLTLKTYIPDWQGMSVTQSGKSVIKKQILEDERGKFVLYTVIPNGGPIEIRRVSL